MTSYTPELISALAAPDADQTAFLEKMGPQPPRDWNMLDKYRAERQKMYEHMLSETGHGEPDCAESYVTIPMRDGFEARGKVWKPTKPAPGGSPLVVLLFGGGFIMGDAEQMTNYARDLCRLFGATCFAPNYRLSPENPFPAAPHDAWDGLVYAKEHAAEWGADLARGFVVGGVSAGANLSAAVSHQAAAEPAAGIHLTGLWLAVPAIFSSEEHVPEKYRNLWLSMEQNKDAPVLNRDATDNMVARYKPDRDSPLYSVTVRGDKTMRAQPKTYLQSCGLDPLRDDAIVYDLMLREAGVPTRVDLYPGLAHAAWAFFPQLPQCIKARSDFADAFTWLLDIEKREDTHVGKPWYAAAG